jgi:hypothetical protein
MFRFVRTIKTAIAFPNVNWPVFVTEMQYIFLGGTSMNPIFFFTCATSLCESWHPQWFRNSKFFQGGVVSLSLTPSLKDQGLHFICPLPFELSGMGGPTRSLRFRQHSSPFDWGCKWASLSYITLLRVLFVLKLNALILFVDALE